MQRKYCVPNGTPPLVNVPDFYQHSVPIRNIPSDGLHDFGEDIFQSQRDALGWVIVGLQPASGFVLMKNRKTAASRTYPSPMATPWGKNGKKPLPRRNCKFRRTDEIFFANFTFLRYVFCTFAKKSKTCQTIRK